jgi:hypothetical protein
MSGAEQLAKAAWFEQGQEVHEFNGATVTNINTDGTVNLNYLGEDHLNIAAMSSYLDRKTGDFVIIRSNGDHWIVIGKVGVEYDPQDHVVIPPIPTIPPIPAAPVMPPSVTWGNADPSPMTGWGTIVATWSHDDGRIYHKRGTITTSPPPPPVQPPPSEEVPGTPGSGTQVITVNPTGERSYDHYGTWNGILADLNLQYVNISRRAQGLNTTISTYPAGPWAGAWFYQYSFIDAVDAGYSKVEILFIRESYAHGPSGSVQPRIYTHYHYDPVGNLDLPIGPWIGPSLALGQQAWWTAPSDFIDNFNPPGGAMLGFACWSDRSDRALIFAPGSGQIKITR